MAVSYERGTPVGYHPRVLIPGFGFRDQGSGTGVRSTFGPISPDSGRDCEKSLRSSYTGLYPQSHHPRVLIPGIGFQGSRGQRILSPDDPSHAQSPYYARLRITLYRPLFRRSGLGFMVQATIPTFLFRVSGSGGRVPVRTGSPKERYD